MKVVNMHQAKTQLSKMAEKVAAELASPAILVLASTASVWDLEIKRGGGKLELPEA